MASLFSHPAVPLALGVLIGRQRLPVRYWVAGAIASLVPDADVLGFALGIPYEAPFGHRGASHSIVFAALLATLLTLRERRHFARPGLLFSYLFASALSHPLLDMLTDGGLGVALLWPVSNERYFFPQTPVAVSPIGRAFFSEGGFEVIRSELRWIWLPCAAIASLVSILRTKLRAP